MVFYKKDYANASDAMQHHDGLTVLSFLYKVCKNFLFLVYSEQHKIFWLYRLIIYSNYNTS